MTRRFVDVSIYLENDVVSDPPAFKPRIEYLTHEHTVEQIASFFPGLRNEDLPDGEGRAVERAVTIDEVPLEWCFQPGVKRDFRHFEDGTVVTAMDVEKELARIGHALQPLEIVDVNTRAGDRCGHDDHVSAGCGMGCEATMYLLERGVRFTGMDAWSWDAPFVHTAKKYGQTQDVSLIWEGHKAGRDIGHCHLEKQHGREALPPSGFFFSCLPHKIRGASAGWTRAVAIFDDALWEDGRRIPPAA